MDNSLFGPETSVVTWILDVMATTPDSLEDPRNPALESIIDELIAAETRIACLEARKAELMSRAGSIADEIGEARKQAAREKLLAQHPDDPIHPKDLPSSQEMARRDLYARMGAALNVTDRTIARWVDHAERLSGDYPTLLASLSAGKCSKAHTVAITEAGMIISDPAKRARFEAALIPLAVSQSVNRVRDTAKRLAERFTDQSLDERAAEAHKLRTVELHALDDDLGLVKAVLPLTTATAIAERLTRMARILKSHEQEHADDVASPAGNRADTVSQMPRTLAQIKADLLSDFILHGSSPRAFNCCDDASNRPNLDGVTAHVQIIIPLISLLPEPQVAKLRNIPGFEHLEQLPGMHGTPAIVGVGPINSRIAKALAGNAPGWDRILTHPVNGVVEQVDRYEPTKSLRRLLIARDEHCRFPGCRMPVRRCDADHTIDWARGGTTTRTNMAYLCRRHHTLKHHSPWEVKQLADGVLGWTSPGGRTYLDRPVSTVWFVSTQPPPDEPAPFQREECNHTCAHCPIHSEGDPVPRTGSPQRNGSLCQATLAPHHDETCASQHEQQRHASEEHHRG